MAYRWQEESLTEHFRIRPALAEAGVQAAIN
jgi:hypothetical protein